MTFFESTTALYQVAGIVLLLGVSYLLYRIVRGVRKQDKH